MRLWRTNRSTSASSPRASAALQRSMVSRRGSSRFTPRSRPDSMGATDVARAVTPLPRSAELSLMRSSSRIRRADVVCGAVAVTIDCRYPSRSCLRPASPFGGPRSWALRTSMKCVTRDPSGLCGRDRHRDTRPTASWRRRSGLGRRARPPLPTAGVPSLRRGGRRAWRG